VSVVVCKVGPCKLQIECIYLLAELGYDATSLEIECIYFVPVYVCILLLQPLVLVVALLLDLL